MPEMSVKEWAAEYRRINEAEQQERIAYLPLEPIEKSVRTYFALCRMFQKMANEADQNPGLQEMRLRDYKDLLGKWELLARRFDHAR
jgi:hypothetical protein